MKKVFQGRVNKILEEVGIGGTKVTIEIAVKKDPNSAGLGGLVTLELNNSADRKFFAENSNLTITVTETK